MKRSLALALALTALAASPASAAAPRDFVGITSDETFQQAGDFRTNNLRAMRSAKVGLIRQVFDWSQDRDQRGRVRPELPRRVRVDRRRPGAERDAGAHERARASTSGRGSQRGAARPTQQRADGRLRAGARASATARSGTLWTRALLPAQGADHASGRSGTSRACQVYWGPRPNAREYVAMLKTVGRAIKEVEPRRRDRHGGPAAEQAHAARSRSTATSSSSTRRARPGTSTRSRSTPTRRTPRSSRRCSRRSAS